MALPAGGDEAPVKVLIADDHPLLLAGIRRALESSPDLQIIGEARSGQELLHMVERRQPQLVLTDLRMPGATGVDCIAALRERWPEVKVVVLSAIEDQATIQGVLGAGANAYVVKRADSCDIGAVVRQVAHGNVFHATTTVGASAARGMPQPTASPLTEREQTIMEAVALGQTTAQISRELWVSEHTVKFHLTNIYRKLDVRNRAGAVRYALEHGLVATTAHAA